LGAKIFVIGFNKCGTTAFHEFFMANGISARHHGSNNTAKNIAVNIVRNISLGRNILFGIDEWTAYTDMNYVSNSIYIEACRFFRRFHIEYPDAYFILPQRDIEGWIRSRMAHGGGSFAERVAANLNCTAGQLADLWRAQHAAHVAEVLKYFDGYRRFLTFDIERDSPNRLQKFLQPTFDVDPGLWKAANVTMV
jgi:hypothetical protein